GKLDADFSRPVDEDEILLRERQHRDAGQVDLLCAGKMRQKVERAFEAGEIDDEAFLGKPPPLGALLPQVLHRRIRAATLLRWLRPRCLHVAPSVCRHAGGTPYATAIIALNSSRSACSSAPSGVGKRARTALARRRLSPPSTGVFSV